MHCRGLSVRRSSCSTTNPQPPIPIPCFPALARDAGLLHQLDEAAEVVLGVVRAGRGFGVVLDGDDGEPPVAHPLDATVVEVDMRDLDLRGEALGLDGEAVVVRGDLDAARAEVFDRLVAAAVAEAQLVGRAAEGAAQGLMAEADAERGAAPPAETSRLISSTTSVIEPGSPGPFDRYTPSGRIASTSAAGVEAGTTLTRQPSRASSFSEFRFTPKS